jgi:hypothetical protein
VPLAFFSVKKPSPLIARSRFEEVVVMLPWVNCCAVFARRTPSPTTEVLRFTAPAAYTSANSAREALEAGGVGVRDVVRRDVKVVLAAVNPDRAMLKLDMGSLLAC